MGGCFFITLACLSVPHNGDDVDHRSSRPAEKVASAQGGRKVGEALRLQKPVTRLRKQGTVYSYPRFKKLYTVRNYVVAAAR